MSFVIKTQSKKSLSLCTKPVRSGKGYSLNKIAISLLSWKNAYWHCLRWYASQVTFMNGKPQPTKPFLGGWVCCGNINNIKQNQLQFISYMLQTFIYQILNSVIQTKKSILVHFLIKKILKPMHTLMCTLLVNPYPYLVKPATWRTIYTHW